MSFDQQLNYMIPISLALIAITLILPVIWRTRPPIAVFAQLFLRLIIVKTGLDYYFNNLKREVDGWARKVEQLYQVTKRMVLQRRQANMEARLRWEAKARDRNEGSKHTATTEGESLDV
ncbi:hypothetical protein V8F06_009620 [Rhypophila decipiens]